MRIRVRARTDARRRVQTPATSTFIASGVRNATSSRHRHLQRRAGRWRRIGRARRACVGPVGRSPRRRIERAQGRRDTVSTLCDGSDRAVVTVNDAKIVGSALVSDNLVITCTNTNATVKLKVRCEVIDKNIIRETVTSQTNEPVDKIIFHRVSEP